MKKALLFAISLLLLRVIQPQSANGAFQWLGWNDVVRKWGNSVTPELLQAAEQGEPNALYGMFVLNPQPYYQSEPYTPETLDWLRKAAEAGHPEAQSYLGFSIEKRTMPNNMAQAIHWYRLSAAQNHPGRRYRLALCYLRGFGVEQDEQHGLELLRQSADEGHTASLIRLADVYGRGIGAPRSENDRPLNLLLRAAQNNSSQACDNLVARYEQGLGTDCDIILAAKWYCRGAVLGGARFPLKTENLDGPLTELPPKSFDAALSLFWKAGIRRDPAAMVHIGEMYLDGREVPRNAATAWQWFNLAVEAGAPGGSPKRSDAENKMTTKELSNAKLQAEALRKELDELSRCLANRIGSP